MILLALQVTDPLSLPQCVLSFNKKRAPRTIYMLVIFLKRTFSPPLRSDPNTNVPLSLPRCCKNLPENNFTLSFRISTIFWTNCFPSLIWKLAWIYRGTNVKGSNHGRRNYIDTIPSMSSLLMFNRVYRLENQSVILVFDPFVNSCHSPKVQFIQTVCGCGGGGGLSCVVGL